MYRNGLIWKIAVFFEQTLSPMRVRLIAILFILLLVDSACDEQSTVDEVKPKTEIIVTEASIKAVVVTEQVKYETDDPAIWVNSSNPSKSLILGTDKNMKGALYVFDLDGKILPEKVVDSLQRPNNVDIEYGFMLDGKPVDIAIVSERFTHKMRIFKLPDMEPLDKGGLAVFEGETGEGYRDIMGISIYKNPTSKKIYAIASRINGPTDGTFLWQYLLEDDGEGGIKATLVRKFGKYSDKKGIESIATDDKLGYVYYSDEKIGVRKYYADPEKGNEELALFASVDFAEDQEGIAIYETSDRTGYILVSDQQNNRFQIFTREGSDNDPHKHQLVRIINTESLESDGSEVTNVTLNSNFQHGLFVAMSDDKTFHYYSWKDIAGNELDVVSR